VGHLVVCDSLRIKPPIALLIQALILDLHLRTFHFNTPLRVNGVIKVLMVCLKTRPVAVESSKCWLVLSGKTGPCCCCAGIDCGCGLGAVQVLLVVGF
jgi:hypothetical protein